MRRAALILVVLAALGVMDSYSQVTTGTILGSVKDSTGAVLPGAKLVILNEDTGAARTVTTDAEGRYSAPSLPVGNYHLTAGLEGFQTEVRSGIVLTIGRDAVVDLQLTVGTVTQQLEVTAEAPLVQTTDAAVGYLVQDRTIVELPLNGRDLTELILLNPSVSQAMYGNETEAYYGFGKKVSIAGGRAEDNVYLLDGSFIGDFSRHQPAGPAGSLMGVETVQEFQVLTNSYSAQYGRVIGGVFNAISKSGTNQLHGDLYEFLRNSDLDANQWENNAFLNGLRPPFRRNQYGGTVGGPIKKDKVFFFLAYEGLRESLTPNTQTQVPTAQARLGNLCLGCPTNTTITTVQVSPKIMPFAQAIPLPSPQGLSNPAGGTQGYVFAANTPTRDDFGQARFDYNKSEKDTFFLRFTGDHGEEDEALSLPMFGQDLEVASQLMTASETHIFSPRALNTFAISFNRVNPTDIGVNPIPSPGMISVPGQTTADVGYGWSPFKGQPFDQHLTNRFNEKDSMTFTLPNHTLQFGGELERMQLNMDDPNRPYGMWTFADITHWLEALPRQFRGTPPQVGSSTYTVVRGFRQWFSGLYLQDTWQLKHRLTVNLGVRWEPYTTPSEVNGLIANVRNVSDPSPTVGAPLWVNHSVKDIGPRVGFAWAPFADGTTSIRGGLGSFYVAIDPTLYYTPVVRVGPISPDLTLTTINPALFPDAVATIEAAPSGVNGSPEGVQYNGMRSPRTYQYNLTVQRQLGKNFVLSIGYVGNRGLNETLYANYNEPPAFFDGTSLAVSPTATILNPNYQGLFLSTNGGNSWYSGLPISLQRRFAGGLQAQISYTYSKAESIGDAASKVDLSGSSGGQLYAQNVPSADKSLSGYNIGQKLSASYSYVLPLGKGWTGAAGHVISGWQLGGILTVQSGEPFSISNATGATPAALSALGFARGPNVNSAFTGPIIEGGATQYFNPAAFYMPSGAFELGNVGRNTLTGPGVTSWNCSLDKNTAINERWHLEFRAEVFNLLNHTNLGKPNGSIFTTNGLLQATAGSITASQPNSARQIQFGLKLQF